VKELLLRIFVEIFHARVRWCAVEVEIAFLNTLAVIALTVGQAKQAFFQDRVPPVPEGDGEAQLLFVIRDSRYPVFPQR
jgi:hypothetical protein